MDKIEQLLTRGVEKIYPSKAELKKVLLSGGKMRIYNGIDPTGKLHLGHTVVLKKLRQFQDLGHEIIVLIGDFTARIGDPTDKLATRKKLAREEIKRNEADYKTHIAKILDLNKANVRFLHNEEWTNKLKPEDMLELASCFTVSQLLERDMFQERLKSGKQIYVHEFIYPIFQAYDSVAMGVDMEIGGNDQTFNMLAGRDLVKKLLNKEKFVLTTKLLTDPTKKKMGKTEGNTINLDDNPEDMFGKIMSWPDTMIISGFELCTDVPMDVLRQKEKDMKFEKLNPRDAKTKLAYEIVKIYHGEEEAGRAQENFMKIFQKKEIPDKIEEIKVKTGDKLADILVQKNIIPSKSEFRRLVKNKAIDVDGRAIEDIDYVIKKVTVVKIGKKKFIRIAV